MHTRNDGNEKNATKAATARDVWEQHGGRGQGTWGCVTFFAMSSGSHTDHPSP